MTTSILPSAIEADILKLLNTEKRAPKLDRIGVKDLIGCLRKAYFKKTINKKVMRSDPLDIGSWSMYLGYIFDERWSKLMTLNQLVLKYPVIDDFKIKGKLDFIDKSCVIDMKVKAKIKNKHSFLTMDTPFVEDLIQVCVYTYMLSLKNVIVERANKVCDNKQFKNVDSCSLLYLTLWGVRRFEVMTKHKLNYAVSQFFSPKEIFDSCVDRAKVLHTSLLTNSAPDVDDLDGCRFCEYSEECKNYVS